MRIPALRGSFRQSSSGQLRKPLREATQASTVGSPPDATGIIEMEMGGVVVRIQRGAEAKTVVAVMHALKATP